MNLLTALWRPFGRGSGAIVGADTDSRPPEPPVTDAGADSEPCAFGDAPDIAGDIMHNAGAPSTLQVAEPVSIPADSRWAPATTHAEMLLMALLEWGFGGQRLASAQLMRCHEVLCSRLHLQPIHWNLVSAQFSKLTNQRKRYGRYRGYHGEHARLRVFFVPKRMPAKLRLVAGREG